jgi:ketosteroid isomerase-like protein
VVRRLYEALGEATRRGELGDFASTPVAQELLDPEVEWHGTIGGLSEGAVSRGPKGVARAMLDDSQEWDRLEFDPTDFIEAGDRVVVLQREHRRGRQSGVEVEAKTAAILWLRDGRVWRVQGYMDPAAALDAVR